MNKKTKLIPELRFPEFVDEGEWEEKKLGKIAKYENGKAHEQNIVKQGNYIAVNSKFISTDGKVKKYTNTANCLANKGEILMVLSDLPNGKALAKCFYVDINNNYSVNQRICKITPINAENKILYYLLNRNSYFLSFDDGVKQTNLRNEDVLKCPLILPKIQKEQQKIASCLSSLDDVIAAQVQKLDLLKDHKKGLMQKLFPQEGEKVPKYRFKKFEKDGEWNLKEFSNYIKLYRGSSPRPIQNYLTQDKNGVNWIKIGDTKNAINSTIYKVEERITLKGAQKSRKVKTGELILANSMSFGKTYELAINGYIYDGWFVLREYENHYYKPFLLQLLNSDYMQRQYQKLSAGGIVQNISSEIVYKTILFHTSFKEQQKIASCLSSLDALITAQTEKIEQLKLHKKGLMQGLFPKIND